MQCTAVTNWADDIWVDGEVSAVWSSTSNLHRQTAAAGGTAGISRAQTGCSAPGCHTAGVAFLDLIRRYEHTIIDNMQIVRAFTSWVFLPLAFCNAWMLECYQVCYKRRKKLSLHSLIFIFRVHWSPGYLFFLIDSGQYVPQSNGTEFPCPLT